MKAVAQWCERHPLLSVCVPSVLTVCGSQVLGPFVGEFVAGKTLDPNERLFATFVAGLILALVLGGGYGYLRGHYSKPTDNQSSCARSKAVLDC